MGQKAKKSPTPSTGGDSGTAHDAAVGAFLVGVLLNTPSVSTVQRGGSIAPFVRVTAELEAQR